MVEWLWDSTLLFLRIFAVLVILNIIVAALSTFYVWWNEGGVAAWAIAFWATLLAGVAWYWWIR